MEGGHCLLSFFLFWFSVLRISSDSLQIQTWHLKISHCFLRSFSFLWLVQHISNTFHPFIISTISLRQLAVVCFLFSPHRGIKINRSEAKLMLKITHWNTWSSHFNNIDVTMETSSHNEQGDLLTKGFFISLPVSYHTLRCESLYLLLPAMIPSSFFWKHKLYRYYSVGHSLVNKAEWNLICGADTLAVPG